MKKFLTLSLAIICFAWSNTNLTDAQKQDLGNKAAFQVMEKIFSKAMEAKRAYLKNKDNFSRANDLLSNVCSTAPANSITINADIDPSLIESGSIIGIDLFASPNNNTSWVSSDGAFNILETSGYESTLQAGIDGLGATTNIDWYISALVNAAGFGEGFETYGTIYASQSPQNTNGQFPPSDNYFSNLIDEPSGDASASQDIVSLGATYKNNGENLERVYFNLGLNGACCDASGGFAGPWYLYGVGMVNPEATESIAYAVGYGDGGFGQLYPGVLKLFGDLSSGELGGYEYISTNMQYEFIGNSLVATTLWNTISQDSQWGEWPNSVNGFIALGVTVEAGLSGFDIYTNVLDETNPGFFIPLTQSQTGNIAPVLSSPAYDNETRSLSVNYSDNEGNLPAVRNVLITNFGTRTMSAYNHDYAMGVTFSSSIDDGDALLPDGTYNATFVFSDTNDQADNSTLDFEFTVGSGLGCIVGDINDDGSLNVSDIVLLVSLILNGGAPNECSDINADGNLNVSDIVLLVSLILNN